MEAGHRHVEPARRGTSRATLRIARASTVGDTRPQAQASAAASAAARNSARRRRPGAVRASGSGERAAAGASGCPARRGARARAPPRRRSRRGPGRPSTRSANSSRGRHRPARAATREAHGPPARRAAGGRRARGPRAGTSRHDAVRCATASLTTKAAREATTTRPRSARPSSTGPGVSAVDARLVDRATRSPRGPRQRGPRRPGRGRAASSRVARAAGRERREPDVARFGAAHATSSEAAAAATKWAASTTASPSSQNLTCRLPGAPQRAFLLADQPLQLRQQGSIVLAHRVHERREQRRGRGPAAEEPGEQRPHLRGPEGLARGARGVAEGPAVGLTVQEPLLEQPIEGRHDGRVGELAPESRVRLPNRDGPSGAATGSRERAARAGPSCMTRPVSIRRTARARPPPSELH